MPAFASDARRSTAGRWIRTGRAERAAAAVQGRLTLSTLPLRAASRVVRSGLAPCRAGAATPRACGQAAPRFCRVPESKRGERVGPVRNSRQVAVVGNHDQVAAGKAGPHGVGDPRRQIDRSDRRLESQPVLGVVDRVAVRAREARQGEQDGERRQGGESGRAHGGSAVTVTPEHTAKRRSCHARRAVSGRRADDSSRRGAAPAGATSCASDAAITAPPRQTSPS